MADNTNVISDLICELTGYGIGHGLIAEADRVYCINRLLELFGETAYAPSENADDKKRDLHLILEDMTGYAVENGMLENDSITNRDLFDTKIMGLITPPPSQVTGKFNSLLDSNAKDATDWYYNFSIATNYIRHDRIKKDIKWVCSSEFGDLDITINLSKPEKDPRDIANALKAPKSGYPMCLLCRENEGYAGTITHPARQNHRIIPITLCNEPYYLQYSPYVYYNEHCIVFNREHTPMKIDEDAFAKLLDFIHLFPHYAIGSNADLPIVGGSILTHDHFQGGNYEFPMVRAPFIKKFKLKDFDIYGGIINWPLSTIRLRCSDRNELVRACSEILSAWREYTDEDSFIYAYTEEDGKNIPHNTITPIARMRNDLYEMDLVLRNNITTPEHPLGVYHPHSEYHHIKKENIGLIEVMGMAILPARLRDELGSIEKIIADSMAKYTDTEAVTAVYEALNADEKLGCHADWIKEILSRDISKLKDDASKDASSIQKYIRHECGIVFSHVLENAGVYKLTDDGIAGFSRFVERFI